MNLTQNRKVFLLIFIAFLASIAVRMIWVYQFNGVEQFKFNNEFMINTNDGYWYAEGARDILSDDKNLHDMSAYKTPTSILTAFFVKILPFSFESIIFYLPALLSSLIVIPIILIGKSLGKLEVGFIAALFASMAWSYYNRTMIGYYDTDMLNIVFPTFLLWSLILAIITKEEKYLIFTSIDIILYRLWYPQSYSLEVAFFSLIFIYLMYQYIKKEEYIHNLALLTFMMFSMINIDIYMRLFIVFSLFIFMKKDKELFFKYLNYIFITAVVLFLYTGGFSPIWGYLKMYIFTESIKSTDSSLQLHFFSVLQTVREAGKISFETFANRISGHTSIFILSIVGYIWLSFKKPIMLLGVPLVGLGFIAYVGGLRFTVYAIPVLAFGIAFLIVELSSMTQTKERRYIMLGILTLAILYPNIEHIRAYKVPTVFTQNEVKVLDELKKVSSREDYIISWWDYGYPIRYYANTRTLIDGNKHSGSVNFPVSYMLTHPQDESAKLARLDVEYTEKRFDKNISVKWQSSNVGQMTLDYGFKDTNDFLLSLQTDIKLPKKTRDIYFYLPNRMLNIYPTVTIFSNLDLMSGQKRKRPFFYVSSTIQDGNRFLDLGRGVKIDKKTNFLIIGKDEVPIRKFVTTKYDKNKELHIQDQKFNHQATFNVVYRSDYGQFLVVDDTVYNSLYFQLFVLEHYDKKLFEPTILTPLVKVYKLKI